MAEKPRKIHDDSRIQEPMRKPLKPRPKQTRDYVGAAKGGTGTWKNMNGVQLGRSLSEDSDFMPSKSTGDLPPTNYQPTSDWGRAIHIHLHGGRPDITGNYSKAAKIRNKTKKMKG